MNSLAALYDLIFARAGSRAGVETNQDGGDGDCRLRALPKEEIDLYVKRIDNSRLLRPVDNRDFVASIGVSTGAALASILIILLLAPGVYGLLASRTMSKLETEHAQLLNDLRMVEAREGRIFSAQSMRNWKEGAEFIEPTSASTVFAPPTETAVASLKK
jgi:hypothetical protein